MKKIVLICLLFLTHELSFGMSKETVPVLIRLATDQQSQQRGYNFVQQFSQLMYSEIISGRLKVWDSHDKKIRITVDSLVAIQDTTETSLSDLSYLFIYQNWTKTKTEINATTLGFSLIAKNKLGENVSYGYVDYADISNVLSKSILKVNANGNYNQNFNYTIMKNEYDFAIIQFGNEVNQNSEESEKIKKEYIADLPFNVTQYPAPPPRKLIQYTIDFQANGNSRQVKFTNAFLTAFQNYLIFHPGFCKQIGLPNTDTTNAKNQINLSNVEVTEMWELKNGVVTQLQQLIITNNNLPLRPLSSGELMDLDFIFEKQNLLALLNQKKYKYTITKINSQSIDSARSHSYQKHLYNLHWSDLNQKVKQP